MLKHYLGLVRFSHTLFAMPFALASMLWAAQGFPSLRIFLLIVVCMVTCRNAAMAFNRLIDADIDKENPRTAKRHIPAGILSKNQVWIFFILNIVIFVTTTYFINFLAFVLSLPALIAVCSYSLTKRFTSYSHFVLGLAIGISPVGAWIAVRGDFAWQPILLFLALTFWIGGFDIIYATQDFEFDRKSGLHSMVVKMGIPKALSVAKFSHALMWLILLGLGWYGALGKIYAACLILITALLIFLHFFRKSASLDSLNQDFFMANIAISLCVLVGIGTRFLF